MDDKRKGEIAFLLDVLDLKDGRHLSGSLTSAAHNLAVAQRSAVRAATETQAHLSKKFGADVPTAEELVEYVEELAKAVNAEP